MMYSPLTTVTNRSLGRRLPSVNEVDGEERDRRYCSLDVVAELTNRRKLASLKFA
jgi:hypothetical protein